MTRPQPRTPSRPRTTPPAAKRTADAVTQAATAGPDEMEQLARTRDEAEDRTRELLAA